MCNVDIQTPNEVLVDDARKTVALVRYQSWFSPKVFAACFLLLLPPTQALGQTPSATEESLVELNRSPARLIVSTLSAPPDSKTPGVDQAVQSTEQAIVLHAGGAVRFRAPGSWQVQECPVGRSIRLMVSMLPIPDESVNVEEGLWLSLRYLPEGPPPIDQEGGSRIARERISTLTRRKATVTSSSSAKIAGAPAICQSFTVKNTSAESRGEFYLVRTSWCMLEICTIASDSSSYAGIDSILSSMVLVRPTVKATELPQQLVDAEPILGVWKAAGCRVRIQPDGIISIASDKFVYGETGPVAEDRNTEVVGRFVARRDVIAISWTDGSQLNFRWKLFNGKLLLTDQNGKIAQLWRLAE